MEALELRKKQSGEDHPEYATGLHNQGILLMKLKQPDVALECFLKALEIRERKLPAGHPDLTVSLNWVATARRSRLDTKYAKSLSSDERVCSHCFKVGKRTKELKMCIGCRMAQFCSKECQNAAWPQHRKVCKVAPEDACFVCLKGDSKSTCSKCSIARYCGRECQLKDWKEGHMLLCDTWAKEKKKANQKK